MIRRLCVAELLLALLAGCGGGTTPAPSASSSGGVPSPTASVPMSPEPSASAEPTPSAEPSPSAIPSVEPSATSSTTPTATPTPTSTPETMIVRAYFLLADPAGGDPALVPVLRTVPKRSATAWAAIEDLLAGPSAKERAASPRLSTTIPAGTTLLDIRIENGTATVDLPASFALAGAGGSREARARLAQVTYTLTQFSATDRVSFELDGEPATFLLEGVAVRGPVTRAMFRDDVLPAIFVDRPAWGAGLLSGSDVTGLANVFEAQFRIRLTAADDTVLVDRPVTASCGSGCWGTFDAPIRYDVSTAQWGTLRVWDVSEGTSQVANVREYPVYLRP